VKRFVDAKIAISPDDVNGIGETHTFVVGRYTVKEVAPFPPGFESDPDTVTVDLALEPGPKDATIAEAFVNSALFRLVVLTCNTSTETLVDSTVDLSGDVRETIDATQLAAGVTEEAL
jgi:hypothetical protein